MALPDYSSSYGSSMFSSSGQQQQGYGQGQGRRNNQNQGRGGNRNRNRNQNRNRNRNQLSPELPPAPVTSAQPSNPDDFGYQEPPLNPGPFTPPSGDLNHPFFDPNASYIPEGTRGNVYNFSSTAGQPGSTPGNIYGTTESPEGYYYGLLNEQGLGGFDARSRAAQSMYSDYARGYQSAKMKNSELWFPQFMQGQNIPQLIQMLSDEQLGIDHNQFRGPLNWTLRG